MRVKKQKRHRRAVKFYTACFGFRHPFKVLCDGTFVHHLIVHEIAPADTALANILGAPVKLFTSRCVIAELKRLGKSHNESLQAARKLQVARCDHEKVKSADACIMEIIGKNNPEHFFVATQDGDLRKKFREVPGVPLVFGLRNALFLEPASTFQREFAMKSEEERLHMNETELKLLKKRTKGILENETFGDSSEENEGSENENLEIKSQKHPTRKGTHIKDRPQYKRNKAKGPNPLSCKKKKNRENLNSASGKESSSADDDTNVRSRGRKRKRSRKGKNLAETAQTGDSRQNSRGDGC